MLGNAVASHEGIRFTTQNLMYLGQCPDEEPALLTLAVGILRGIESGRCCVGNICTPAAWSAPMLGVDASIDTRHFADSIV
jgi:hypothetical protein